MLRLAVADELIRRNPADNPVVRKPSAGLGGKVEPWSAAQVAAVTDAHPGHLRLLPELMTACGLRVAEALAWRSRTSTLTRASCMCAAS